ncbi:MAG: helix-turn-helix transcriptional regulator [Ilumatobacteraceae bacterium]|nr:helix-turn-helix transcriptional regulator [Ilumatobacteraceae bacterium]
MPPSVLEEADAAAVLGVVEELTAAESIDEFARLAMVGLRELISCIDISYNEMNPSAGRIEWMAEPANPRMADFTPVFSRLMRQNPLVGYFERTADTRAMMWSDLVPFEQLQRTELYQEMFRPLGIRSQMAMIVPTPPGIVVGFAANTERPCFSERDRAVFNTLRPHLAHGYRSIQLRDLVRRSPGWTGALADEHGVVHAVTDDAGELADRAGVVLEAGQPLPDALRTSFVEGVNGYRASDPAVLSATTRLSEEAGGVAGWHVPGPVGPHVVVVQTQVDDMSRRMADAGLTRRQTEVAIELVGGGTNAAIAARLGIAEGTVRKHLEQVYRAVDVTDRASAIARIRGW